MVYAYIRYSTDSQDDTQQMQALSEYASQHSITIDEFERDEGISGGVSFRNRNLNRLVKKLHPGDILITAEISRLGRSISDINILVNEELKKRGVRLIITKMGIDLNCASMKAADQMLIFAFGFAAEVEKEMIQSRTQSAIDARKEWIKRDGGFLSKSGNFCDHLGRQKGDKNPNAVFAMNSQKIVEAEEWKQRSPLYLLACNMILKGEPRAKILSVTSDLYDKDPVAYGTRQGKRLCAGTLSKWASEVIIRN